NMRMGFDEARHERHARHLDHLGIGGRFDFTGRAGGFDAFATYKHRPAVVQLRRFTIEDACRLEQINGRVLGGSSGPILGGDVNGQATHEGQGQVAHSRQKKRVAAKSFAVWVSEVKCYTALVAMARRMSMV